MLSNKLAYWEKLALRGAPRLPPMPPVAANHMFAALSPATRRLPPMPPVAAGHPMAALSPAMPLPATMNARPPIAGANLSPAPQMMNVHQRPPIAGANLSPAPQMEARPQPKVNVGSKGKPLAEARQQGKPTSREKLDRSPHLLPKKEQVPLKGQPSYAEAELAAAQRMKEPSVTMEANKPLEREPGSHYGRMIEFLKKASTANSGRSWSRRNGCRRNAFRKFPSGGSECGTLLN